MKLVLRLARLGELLLALAVRRPRWARRQMELRAARAAARRRVGAYTAIVTAVGFAWLVLAAPAAAPWGPSAAGAAPSTRPSGASSWTWPSARAPGSRS